MQGEPTFRTLASGTTSVTNAALGKFDPTLLLNGMAEIRLRATDTTGQTSTFGPVTVVVTQNEKIGNFTVSFNDLTVPVAGLPIQVIRTYDSRDKRIGDFGVGWRLDLNSVSITTNGALGDNWTGTASGGFFPTYCIQPGRPHVVTVTMSDGTVYQFQATLNPSCQQLVPLSQTAVGFVPVSTTPANASLTIIGNAAPFVAGDFAGPITLLDLDDATTLDPHLYQLTLPDGRTVVLSTQTGLQSLTDLDGNKLTVSSAGITHSSGKSVAFQRDSSNRIAKITDPAGNSIGYAYDGSGDLVSVRDAGGNVTTFTYNGTHGLLTITDPRGIQPIRNVYDNSGRLIQHIDAFGRTITYTHDLATRQEVVTDRLGNVTVNEYDTRGNVVQVTDAAGGVTGRTYDAHNNLLSETNALNQTRTYTYDTNDNRLTETDPLGQTTSYTYNSRNQVLVVTDPLGRVTTNVYNPSGNLVSTTDPAGNATAFAYDAHGLRTSMTDPLGGVTAYAYDGSGNLLSQTDPLGHTSSFTYDANGNRLTETKAGVTQYQYDAQNRVTRTVFPDGSSTQTTYNNIGKQAATIDQLGRPTSYTYDQMGRLVLRSFPDATSESASYDAEGRRLTSTDRAGHLTQYGYDPLGRLIATTFADGTSTATQYDAVGEALRVTDAGGNATSYAYDPAGRRVSATDSLGHVTTFGYDRVGNQVAVQDANGNSTQYQYDASNRRVGTMYPDSTSDAVAFDALGRTVSKTDQAGQTTQFRYDGLGRLIAVIDALNQQTSYTYDALGNRTSQTDANGHVTQFAYDLVGRRTARTLPLGMTETYTYNAAGGMVSKTDFNGKTTTYAYDAMERLVAKTPDALLHEPTVQFSYSLTGQRTQMSDASGVTTYAYDIRDRLVTKTTPEGTLTYAYDTAGNLSSIRSSNTGGTSVNYSYDALNRLSAVTDNRLAPGTTTYGYDNVGNLQTVTYPNAVTHLYAYDALNRLGNLSIATQASTLASYAYTLGPSGNRTAVADLGGRQVNYMYDALYRLTRETVTGGAVNGTATYQYDPVGNRLSRLSTLPPGGPTTSAYDANDRLTTEAYDANGSAIVSNAIGYTYDFENRLIQATNGTSIVYDGDGNRVAETAGGVPTQYLVDDRNLTGYAQVLEEIVGGTVQRVYTYGLNRLSESQASGTSFYGYDGHGNVRLLTGAIGAVTDRYDYDAFGNLLTQAGTTSNVYQYSGEQSDPNLGFYYLRARYYRSATGRFTAFDSFEGDTLNPSTLHKYLYTANDPVNKLDPNGQQFIVGVIALETALSLLSETVQVGFGTILNKLYPNVQEGDVIMRLGADDVGLWPATQSLGIAFVSSGPYSHIGIITRVDNNDPLNSTVRHSYHGVQNSTVREFVHGGGSIGPSIPGGVYSNIFRFNGSESVATNAASKARGMSGPYDQAYDLSDTPQGNSAYYCSEFVWKAYGGPGYDIAGGNRTVLNYPEYLLAKHLHPQLSTNAFVTPNDIFYSSTFRFAGR
jgi:RHS repeat-associated protein